MIPFCYFARRLVALNLLLLVVSDLLPAEVQYKDKEEDYKPPDRRACGRPHNSGWLNLLGDEEMTGGFAADLENEVYESDNWRKIISKRQRIGGNR